MPDREPNESDRASEFVELYGQHQFRLFHYICPLVPSLTDAEDVMQEVATVLWQRFDEFESGTNFLAWARSVAHYRVLEFRRAQSRQPAFLSDDALERVSAVAETMEDEFGDQREALNFCYEKLSDAERRIIMQRYTPGETLADLAQQENRPVDSIYQSIRRIRHRLTECIRRRLAANDHTEGLH